MNDNLQKAMQVMPDDASEEEKKNLREAIWKAEELSKEMNKIKKKNK